MVPSHPCGITGTAHRRTGQRLPRALERTRAAAAHMRTPASRTVHRGARRWRLNQGGRWVADGAAVRYLTHVNTTRYPKARHSGVARVHVKRSPGRGRGLYATRDIAVGETVVFERPLCSVIEDGEEETCGQCGAWLSCAEVLVSLEVGERVALPQHGRYVEEDATRAAPTDVTSCRAGCGVRYCGARCERTAWLRHHQLLCAAKAPEVTAFLEFATGERHGFRLAARVVAHALIRHTHARRSGAPPARALRTAWAPYSSACRAVWWEAAGEDENVTREMRGACATGAQLLRRALQRYLSCDDGCAAALLTTSTFSTVLSSFEMNNLDVFVPSPVHRYLDWYEKRRLPAKGIARFHALDCVSPARGTAFYTFQSCANHSCVPNAEAATDVDVVGAVCHLRALRPIAAGAEVTISYIDTEQATAERQADLASYGFACVCPKCKAG